MLILTFVLLSEFCIPISELRVPLSDFRIAERLDLQMFGLFFLDFYSSRFLDFQISRFAIESRKHEPRKSKNLEI